MLHAGRARMLHAGRARMLRSLDASCWKSQDAEEPGCCMLENQDVSCWSLGDIRMYLEDSSTVYFCISKPESWKTLNSDMVRDESPEQQTTMSKQ